MMYKKKSIFMISMLILMSASVFADTEAYCLNSTTLFVNTTQDLYVGGKLTRLSLVENVFCPYNCSTSLRACQDNNANTDYQIPLIIGLVFIAFVFGYLAIELDETHKVLQLLFLIFTMFILYTISSLLSTIAQRASQVSTSSVIATVSSGILWIIIFIIAYFLIRIFYYGAKAAWGGKTDSEEVV